MNAPFGIAVYPDRGKRSLGSLPHIRTTHVLNDSQYGLIEDHAGRLVTTMYRSNLDTQPASDYRSERELPRRAGRGIAGRETTGVRRRSTTVRRELADEITLRVVELRQRIPRSRLARAMSVTPRQLHLAELGSVQPDALERIAGFLGIDIS